MTAEHISSSRIVIGIEPSADINPFPGLRSFEPDEDYLFFGRERQIDELLRKLRTTRFLSILGRSGSGKSSLVRSGLIPSLYGGGMTRAGSRWRVAIMRPGENPLANLAKALSAPDALAGDGELASAFFETTLRASRLGLVECVRQSHVADNVLVLVDQFEEIFRYKRSRRADGVEEAAAFVKLLLAPRETELPIYIAITMRSDFIGDCMEFGTLPEVINQGIYLVPRMTREELRSAVAGPVAVGGARIAPRLVSRLLNDVGDDPDQLPILQHAMMRTWERWQSEHIPGEPLDLRHYEDIGTMDEALSRHAEEAFGELDEPGQRIAEKMFKALTDKATDPRGVRRPASVGEICAVAGASLAEVTRVAESFRKPGRSFLMPPADIALEESSILDISHESLMRIWERLSQWADDEAHAGQLYLNLAQAAQRHEEGRAALWRDPELQFALTWREKEQPTAEWAERYDPSFARAMAFLDASEAERDAQVRERELRRRRALRQARAVIAVLSIAFLAMVGLGWTALRQKDAAQRSAQQAIDALELAQRQRGVAETQKQIAETERTAADRERIEAQRQRLQAETQKQVAQQQSERAENEQKRAETEQQKALDNERKALAQQTIAVAAKEDAVIQKTNAESERTNAQRLSHLATARALALKARETPNLDARLVLEAYRLTRENGGDLDDPELFGALQAVGSRHGHVVEKLAQTNGATALAVSPDDDVYAGDELGQIVLHSNAGPKIVGRVAGPVRTLALRGHLLAAGADSGKIAVWDVRHAGEAPRQITVGTAPVMAAAFRPAGSLLAAGSLDGSVTLVDVSRDAPATVLQAPDSTNKVRAVAFSPDGTLVAANQLVGALVWNIAQPKAAPRRMCGGSANVRSLAFTPDGSSLLCGRENGEIDRESLRDGELPSLHGHTGRVTSLSFSERGDVLASASLDGTIRLWRMDRPDSPPSVIPRQESWIWAAALTADGNRVVSGGKEGWIRITDARTDVLARHLCSAAKYPLTKTEWSRYAPDEPYPEEVPCPK